MNQLNIEALAKLIKDSGIPHKASGLSWIFTCPRCVKKDKLYIRKTDGRFVCWYCATISGYQGRPDRALADLTSLPITEVRRRLYDGDVSEGAFIELPDYEPILFPYDEERPEAFEPLKQVAFPLEFVPIDHPHAARGRAYLEQREIPLTLAVEYGLQYYPQDRRVIFPIVVGGQLVGWQARTIEPSEWVDEQTGAVRRRPKILTSPGVDRARVLMWQDRLVGSTHAVLTEGPIDALKCHLCGGNVASMGKSVSLGQLRVLWESGVRRVYLALDPDAAAEITRLCRELCGLEVYLMSVPKSFDDFGAMSLAAVRRAFHEAQPVNAGFAFAPLLDDIFPRAH